MAQDEPDMSYLDSLNQAQLEGSFVLVTALYKHTSPVSPSIYIAVRYPKDGPLQILAGPGSGKTAVLTSRVAYLVHYWGLKPWEITAVSQ
jgi:hypothetical protein